MGQARHHPKVLPPGEQVVHRRELTGEGDELVDGGCLANDVVPADEDATGVRRDERGQDVDRGGLARPVGAEECEHGPAGDGEGDAVQYRRGAVRLVQCADLDGGWWHGRPPLRTIYS